MDERAIEQAAELLIDAHAQHKSLEELPPQCRPATLDEAYAIQDAFARGLGTPAGYKIAYTNPELQRRFNVPEPVWGQLFRERILESPAEVPWSRLRRPAVEPEIGFRMAADLPAPKAPFSPERVAASVDVVIPAIEVADSRFAHWERMGPLLSVADNALASHWVTGTPTRDWSDRDLRELRVVATVDGEHHSDGRGEAVLGGPLEALVWLANAMAARNRQLRAGDHITTGCITRAILPDPGQTIAADFGPLGQVQVSLPTR